ncbi:hypothetical protein PGTUg99_034391 [Puccinia graminis f. sp. tritici]|uniref:MmgE/PrpD C-terminal domain-containing protein n=1 Tax=Puccinia graminis f. sp. tritici TaxID=56615 RepID=A0A5B0Q9X4_PUCGR|nr:hypothetical protein PGTUg99_034391 [Puccinia graminis f. sp. tritici]
MVTIPLIFGRLTTEDYTDKVALDLKIDELRAKISCTEEKKYSAEYHPPDKCSIGNAIMIELKDRTVLDKVEIKYSVGPKRCREEGKPLLDAKLKRHIKTHNCLPLSSFQNTPTSFY